MNKKNEIIINQTKSRCKPRNSSDMVILYTLIGLGIITGHFMYTQTIQRQLAVFNHLI
jgi:hypothetical protein